MLDQAAVSYHVHRKYRPPAPISLHASHHSDDECLHSCAHDGEHEDGENVLEKDALWVDGEPPREDHDRQQEKVEYHLRERLRLKAKLRAVEGADRAGGRQS